jgi:hypothetical protein
MILQIAIQLILALLHSGPIFWVPFTLVVSTLLFALARLAR